MIHRCLGMLAAVLLGTAAGVVGLAVPAHAAACAPGTGVTVVVDSGVRCDADGGTGERATTNFADAGHTLSFASRSAGFVCRVDGRPAADPCTVTSPADAYWALFWSDGTSGTWAYSSLGVGALRVPKGGAVAFVFQTSESRTQPSVPAPVAPAVEAGGGSVEAPSPAKPRKPRPKKSSAAPVPPSRATAEPSVAPSTDPPSVEPTPGTEPTSAPTTASTPTPGSEATVAGDMATSVDPVPMSDESAGAGRGALVVAMAVVFVLVLAGGIAWRRRQDG